MDGSRSSDDKVFQAAGPDVENVRGPNVDVSVLGTTNWLSSADRSETDPRQKKSVHRVWSGTPALALADTCACTATVAQLCYCDTLSAPSSGSSYLGNCKNY